MGKMNVKKTELLGFLELMTLKGSAESKEGIISFKQNEISTCLAQSQAVALKGTMSGNFEDWGELGIDDLTIVKTFIGTIAGDTVTIDHNKNKLKITDASGKVKTSSVLRNIDYITNSVSAEKFQTLLDKTKGNEFDLKPEQIEGIIKYAGTVKSDSLFLSGTGKTITLKTKNNQNEIEATFDIETEVTDFDVKLPSLVIDMLSLMKKSVKISAKTDTPIYLKVEQNNCVFEFLVAPKKK